MPTSFIFDGFTVAGLCGRVNEGPFDNQITITKFPGVIGESALLGLRGGRDISFEALIYGNVQTYSAMSDAIRQLGNKENVAGVLVTENQTYDDCTFMGFRPSPEGILPSIGGIPDVDNGYWVRGLCLFRQHK